MALVPALVVRQIAMTAVWNCAGTLVYMAPEMKEAEDIKGPPLDIFSAGVLAAEIATGAGPSPGPEMVRQGRQRVAVPEEDRRAADIAAAPDELRVAVVARCIRDDPAERPTAGHLVTACRELQRGLRYGTARAQLDDQNAAAREGAEAARVRAAVSAAAATNLAAMEAQKQAAAAAQDLAVRTAVTAAVNAEAAQRRIAVSALQQEHAAALSAAAAEAAARQVAMEAEMAAQRDTFAAQIEAMEAQRAEDVEPAGAAAARSEQEQEDMAFARQLQEEEQAEQATGSRPDIQIVPNRLEWSGKPFLPSLYVCVPCVRGSVWCHLVGCVF